MSAEVRAIEEFFRRRFGREALFLPSGRLALYLALREWLRPGDHLLMSPVNDDVVFFIVLAAGLVPVLAPVDPNTGNIDPAAIDDSTWTTLRGVMTTNLYGIPDRMDLLAGRCARHGLVMIEDACHALDSRFSGRRIGTFGTAAAYSLGKHVGGVGGVLTFAESGRRESLVRRSREEMHRFLPTIAHNVRVLLSTVGASTHARRRLARLRDQLVPRPLERVGHRTPYKTAEVLQAQKAGGGLNRFDPWVGIDHAAYRMWPLRRSLQANLRRLEAFEENRRLRLEGTRALLDAGLVPSSLPIPSDTALFRVPLFVQDRETEILRFAQREFPVDYIYDPPLDVYAPELAERVPSPSSARHWSRNVLPVDPLLAGRFLALLREGPRLSMLATGYGPHAPLKVDQETAG